MPGSLGEIDMAGPPAPAVPVSPSAPLTDVMGRARDAWERAGRPGASEQLVLEVPPPCTCGGRGICLVCVLASLEVE